MHEMVFQQYEKLRDVYSLRSDLKKQNLEIDLISMLHKVCEKRMSCVKKNHTHIKISINEAI